MGSVRSRAQEHPSSASRTSSALPSRSTRKGIDEQGRMISAARVSGGGRFSDRRPANRGAASRARAATPRASLLDSIIAAVNAETAARRARGAERAFRRVVGQRSGARPSARVRRPRRGARDLRDEAARRCHGARGTGRRTRRPRRSIPSRRRSAARARWRRRSPAMIYRMISVGVAGTAMAGVRGPADAEPALERRRVSRRRCARRRRQVAEGEGLYAQRCASCHGMTRHSATATRRAR